MGSHVSPVMANTIMEIYKEILVCTAKLPPNYNFPLEDRNLPFLDTLLREDDESLEVTMYRKPTHLDRYLNF